MCKIKIAIIGCGPRGLASLENLFLELSTLKKSILDKVILFDASGYLGAGKAWDLDQAPTNLINISDHALQDLKGREKIRYHHFEIPSFPSYSDWCKSDPIARYEVSQKDLYPARLQMGRYLHERFKSIFGILIREDLAISVQEEVTSLNSSGKLIEIITENSNYHVNECLLTTGHQHGKESEQAKNWKNHEKETDAIYIHHPYETNIYHSDLVDKQVAIKGFGLSMIDICGMLTSGKHGTFQKQENSNYLKYVPTEKNRLTIVPFSLDGLPVVPKPFGRDVDQYFLPTIQQLHSFDLSIRNHLANAGSIENIDFLIEDFSMIASEIINENNQQMLTRNLDKIVIAQLIQQWLKNTSLDHECFLDQKLPVREYMIATVEMAMGDRAFTLDYALNQIWRQLQPTMYRLFAHTNLKKDVIKAIIDLDESTKRYSYGPPVQSILELIALQDAGILDLRFIVDPEIKLTPKGWELQKEGKSTEVSVMINSILAGPELEQIDTPVFEHLKKNKYVQEVAKGLGIKTNPDGTIIPENPALNIPIALVGRNAKGSILGTDAILECFSPEISGWAKGIIKRRNQT